MDVLTIFFTICKFWLLSDLVAKLNKNCYLPLISFQSSQLRCTVSLSSFEKNQVSAIYCQIKTFTHYLPSGIRTVDRHVFGKGASFIIIWRELTIQQWDIKDTTGKNPLALNPLARLISWPFVSIIPHILNTSSSVINPP